MPWAPGSSGPAIAPPYRWRDWAARQDGITGDELIAFINQDEAVRPDATRGPGLFQYLRSLQSANGGDRRDVIANVFRGVVKTKPLQYEEFADCLAWWPKRKENDRDWKVPVADVRKYDASGQLVSANLDVKDPSAAEVLEHLAPEQLADGILAQERRIMEIMAEIKAVLAWGSRA